MNSPTTLPLLALALCAACGEKQSGTPVSLPDVGSAAIPDAGSIAPPDSGVLPDSGVAQCVRTVVFADVDDDDFGVSDQTMDSCLLPDEKLPGYARVAGDCGPTDPWRNPAAEEICSDNVDDDCDGVAEACPTTRTAGLDVPDWDCFTGPPPSNVYAWASFADGGTFFQPNGCFVFFEGLRDEFYVRRVNVRGLRTDPICRTQAGCICPSLDGFPSHDRRLYAFTTIGDLDACAKLRLINNGDETQPVSNDCRKYLYQLHLYDIPYSYLNSSLRAIERRVRLFPQVEIACAAMHRGNAAQDQYPQTPFVTLVHMPIQKNPAFVKK